MNFGFVRNSCVIAAIIIVFSSSAIATPFNSGQIKSQKSIIYVDNANECSNEWAALLNNWESNGGGIQDSVWTAREQIKKDKKSKFAQIVRKIWAAQKVGDFNGRVFGGWPIPNDAMSAAVWRPSRDTGHYMASILPSDCAALGALRPLFWDRMVVRSHNGKRACEPRYVEMPEKLTWDPQPVSSWILYWLFVRIDAPIKRSLVRTSPDKVCFEDGRQWITPSQK